MRINSFRKTRTYQTLSTLFFITLLSGCAEFHEKYDSEKEAWARHEGDKSLTVQGYRLNDKRDHSCFSEGFKAVVIPDDDYAKKYAKFLIKTNNDPFMRSLSPEGQSLIHYSEGQGNCTYRFRNLPAGKWVVIFDIQNSLMPLITVATDKGPASGTKSNNSESYIWAPIEIKPGDHDLKKKLVFNQSLPKNDAVLNFKWGDNVSVNQGQLIDWDVIPRQE